jgi:hypothetical protein
MSSLLGAGGVVVVEEVVWRLRKRDRRLGKEVVAASATGAAVVEDLGTKRERSRKSWLRAGARLGEDLGASAARAAALKW